MTSRTDIFRIFATCSPNYQSREMKIIQPQYEIWEQAPGEEGIYKQVERAGRVCYKSEDHASTDTARPFTMRMIANQHTAMLEHATVYLQAPHGVLPFYASNRFSVVNTIEDDDFITTNLRVLVENHRLDDMQYLRDYTSNHERRITVHFTTQISITREYNRHRVNSIAEQSTRYCNYSKNKFGNEITINLPSWVAEQESFSMKDEQGHDTFTAMCRDIDEGMTDEWNPLDYWIFANLAAEFSYLNLIKGGCKPQEARAILPLDTNTELVHTAFVRDWKHFFDLRAKGTTGAPHPDAKALALPLMEEFQKRGYIGKHSNNYTF